MYITRKVKTGHCIPIGLRLKNHSFSIYETSGILCDFICLRGSARMTVSVMQNISLNMYLDMVSENKDRSRVKRQNVRKYRHYLG